MNKRASQEIVTRRTILADALMARAYPDCSAPEFSPVWSERAEARQEADFHIATLAQAVAMESPLLFADYVGWAKIRLAQRGIASTEFAFQLKYLADLLTALLPADICSAAVEVVDYARRCLPELPDDLPTLIDGRPHAELTRAYLDFLLRGERGAASELIVGAAERGIPVREIYVHVFERTQHEVGRLWQTGAISVAQEHYCTGATQLIMSQLYPYIFAGEKGQGAFVGACVAGDLHELGGRMIADFFELAGWKSHFLGADTPADGVVETTIEHKADVLGISVTIPQHLSAVEELIHKVRANPACSGVKILVGGYPFNVAPDLWRTVHADGTARGAVNVIEIAESLTRMTPANAINPN